MPVQEIISYKEEKAIEELQMRMKNSLPPALRDDEFLLYRFLKAREFDVDRAEKMLRKNIMWRKMNQVDTIVEDFKPSEFFFKFIEPSLIGYDKEGAMVRYSPTGKFNPVEIFKSLTFNTFMKNWFWFAEHSISLLNEENKRTGRNAFRAVIIFDLEKLSFLNATSRIAADIFLRFVNVYQDNYPERMKSAYVINAPYYYVTVFSILKTVMSNAMVKKIHIFGSTGWKEKLLEIIDADVLPAFLGGNRTDPDGNPMCLNSVTHGGKISEHYFLSYEDRYCFKDTTQVKKIIVPPTNKEEIQVEVEDLGSLIRWEFFVKGKDIGFGVFFQASEHKVTEIIPVHRYSTSDGIQRDSYRCRSYTGKYIIVFDNLHSWMTSKEVQYCLTVDKPKL